MQIKQKYVQKRLKELLDIYKVCAIIILQSISLGDFDSLIMVHSFFVQTSVMIDEFVEKMCPSEDIKYFKERKYKSLPAYLEQLKIIAIYRESIIDILAGFAFSDEQNILMNKMSLDIDPDRELAYLNISQMLNKMKKYPEALNVLEFLDGLLNSTPVMMYAIKIFNTIGQYDKSIECYQKILKMWPKNRRVERKLYKVCDEVLS